MLPFSIKSYTWSTERCRIIFYSMSIYACYLFAPEIWDYPILDNLLIGIIGCPGKFRRLHVIQVELGAFFNGEFIGVYVITVFDPIFQANRKFLCLIFSFFYSTLGQE